MSLLAGDGDSGAAAIFEAAAAAVVGRHSRGVLESTSSEQAGLVRGGDGPGRDQRL